MRGQRWTDAQRAPPDARGDGGSLTAAIRARGVSNDGYTITRAFPDARGAVTSTPTLSGLAAATAKAIWIPRAALLEARRVVANKFQSCTT